MTSQTSPMGIMYYLGLLLEAPLEAVSPLSPSFLGAVASAGTEDATTRLATSKMLPPIPLIQMTLIKQLYYCQLQQGTQRRPGLVMVQNWSRPTLRYESQFQEDMSLASSHHNGRDSMNPTIPSPTLLTRCYRLIPLLSLILRLFHLISFQNMAASGPTGNHCKKSLRVPSGSR
jgi:hypothetical protein